MKGVIFNLLEASLTQRLGPERWEEAIERAGVDGAYTSLGSYPHEELIALVGAVTEPLGMTADEVLRWFGREALAMLAASYPQFFEPHDSTGPFLLTLNEIIHPEVRKLYPGAEVPAFDYRVGEAERLVMGYRSQRGLCVFGEGLIEGAAEHYGERAAIAQPSCTNRGDPECVFEVELSR